MGPMITYVYEICGSEYQAAVTILQSGVPWTLGYSIIAFIGKVYLSFPTSWEVSPTSRPLQVGDSNSTFQMNEYDVTLDFGQTLS